jgi:hypothetical protein
LSALLFENSLFPSYKELEVEQVVFCFFELIHLCFFSPDSRQS